jgi:hypothetical protein
MRRFVAISVVSTILVLGGAAPMAQACGCGVVAAPDGAVTTTTGERAIISMDGGIETIDFSFDLNSDELSMGILIPTPGAAEISIGDGRTFDLIENTTKPTIVDETDPWGIGYFAENPEQQQSSELDRVSLSPVEVNTMAPGDSKSISRWLKRNKFVSTPETLATMQLYATQGWTINAIRITGNRGLDGHIDPIRLSFHTAQMVYPFRFARADATPRSLRLYVFDATRTYLAQGTQRTLELDAPVDTHWAGPTPDPRLKHLGRYLTILDVTMDDPVRQATSDIAIVPSSVTGNVSEEATRYRTVTLLGIPVGTLIVGWVLLGLIFALTATVRRRRAR